MHFQICRRKVNRLKILSLPQGILQGIYWGLGTGIGSILGGVIISEYGIVPAYRIGGTATMVVTLYFVISQWLVNKYEAATASNPSDEVKLTDDCDN